MSTEEESNKQMKEAENSLYCSGLRSPTYSVEMVPGWSPVAMQVIKVLDEVYEMAKHQIHAY